MSANARILLVGDAEGLAESLRRRLSGVAEVALEPAGPAALVRALIERPAAVLYALPDGAADFSGDLLKSGCDATHFLRVPAGGAAGGGQTPSTLDPATEHSLLEALADQLANDPPQRRTVEMLASLSRLGHGGGGSVPSFANVLELGEETVLIEAPLPLDRGDRLALGFFLQRDAVVSGRRISLSGTVRSVRDERQLHYEVEIEHSSSTSRDAIRNYLTGVDPVPGDASEERSECSD